MTHGQHLMNKTECEIKFLFFSFDKFPTFSKTSSKYQVSIQVYMAEKKATTPCTNK